MRIEELNPSNSKPAPVIKQLEADGSTFYFTQGANECTPPDGFLDYFGPEPHYRFIDFGGTMQKGIIEGIRDFPQGEVAEDVIRELVPDGQDDLRSAIDTTLRGIYATMDEQGPFDAICAYSEGATVAATLILDEKRRFEQEGRERHFKSAIFICGWPPLDAVSGELLLSDSCDDVIDIPTCHVIGSGDPYLQGSMALYNICDGNMAYLFDHGKGHIIPRDPKTTKELANVVFEMVREISTPSSPDGSP